MRVVYLNLKANLGSAERCLLDLLASLPRVAPDVEPHVVCLEEGPLIHRVRALGVPVTLVAAPRATAQLDDSALYDWSEETGSSNEGWLSHWHAGARGVGRFLSHSLSATWPLRRFSRELQPVIASLAPDLLHSNGNKTHLLTRLIGLEKTPAIWHVHDFLRAKPVTAAALRWASSRASIAIASSGAVARDAAEVLSGVAVEAVHPGIDLASFHPPAPGVPPGPVGRDAGPGNIKPGPVGQDAGPGNGDHERLDELAGLPPAAEGIVRVGMVATDSRWKGHRYFLEALGSLSCEARARLRAYLIGGPLQRTIGSQPSFLELNEEARRRQLEVGFIEFQDEIAPLYRGLDLLVHASTTPEPFGLTVVEGMATGLPVLSTALGGVRELFLPGVEGVVIPADQPAQCGELLLSLIDDPAKRRELGTRARRAAVTRFSRERFAERIVGIYRRLYSPHAREAG